MTKKYRKIANDFDRLISNLDGVASSSYIHAKELKKKVFALFDALKLEVERQQQRNHKSAPVNQRFVNLVETESSNSKVTYRPETGECLIKVSKGMPAFKVVLLKQLGDKIIEGISNDVKMTLRGTVHWSESQNDFRVRLQDNNRSHFKFNF